MKTLLKIMAFSAILLGQAGIMASCEKKDKKNKILLKADCKEKKVLRVLTNELGFIRVTTDPAINRLCYYFFEPIVHIDSVSLKLHIDTDGCNIDPTSPIQKFEVGQLVRVSGNVTNCLSLIYGWCENSERLVMREYNILELTSIHLDNYTNKNTQK